ncbi:MULTISPECIES: type II toxin-antitoxin system RelE/ParE family toxin [unclassified Rhizobium]|uniref:type II toxin-antitoxin system RelE/ParE family toxin n=1 Tax=unclassified Rhizobium TaxID=2613769 RepID=UPI000CDF38F1|nr:MULTISPECIES: type II toxin-antitoxin system RelE/ParE family toxin [Rhizobium]AVA20612.1 toxin-antitoxin system toxin RelE/ParE family protein [Rhizobium sp. NXC24]UWU21884.1 type II toxin-antitoxin system RelE/ParE family toxin [Rhizobium tropici]
MPRIRYLASARADFDSIYRYIRQEGGSAESARNFIGRLRGKCRNLAELPGQMGRARPELLTDVRSFAFRGYVIFFRYVDDVFEVVNIIEGHRDLESHFDGDR